jgi:carbamoyltransferase
MFSETADRSLDWSVYSGPNVAISDPLPGWSMRRCSPAECGRLLHDTGEPVVFLSGRAELGPRALGHRSILAPAVNGRMKDVLNRVKERESYRPVSPICLEDRATDIFYPGSPDPYMLFDHRVAERWQARTPAICHLDGTARLQTISRDDSVEVVEALNGYSAASGVPLLCNTSANRKGRGFFPDASSAMAWGGSNYVWCNGHLFERLDKVALPELQ